MKKKLLIAITILLIFVFSIMHEQLALFESLFVTEPVFEEQELTVPTDGNAVCVQEDQPFIPGIYIVQEEKVEGITGVEEKEKMIAYITYKMIEEGGEEYKDESRGDEYSDTPRQEAIWAVMNEIDGKSMGDKHDDDDRYFRLVDTDAKKYQGGLTAPTDYEYSSAPGFVKLYSDAKDYATRTNGTAEVLTAAGNLISEHTDATKITGPYRITFGENGELKNIVLGKSDIYEGVIVSQEDKKNVWVCDETGEPKKIVSDEDFYIAIDTTKTGYALANENKITIDYTWNEYSLPVQETLVRKENAEGTDQRIAYFEAEKEEKITTLELNLPKIIPPIEIKFKKVDENGNPLEGIEFQLYNATDGTLIDTAVSTIGEDGEAWVTFKPYYPNQVVNTETFRIVEIFKPGYDILKYTSQYFKPSKYERRKNCKFAF